jgi:hypothetical protein
VRFALGLFGSQKQHISQMVAATRAGDVEKVRQFEAKGVDMSASEAESGDTALRAAIEKGQWATRECLLTHLPSRPAVRWPSALAVSGASPSTMCWTMRSDWWNL